MRSESFSETGLVKHRPGYPSNRGWSTGRLGDVYGTMGYSVAWFEEAMRGVTIGEAALVAGVYRVALSKMIRSQKSMNCNRQ